MKGWSFEVGVFADNMNLGTFENGNTYETCTEAMDIATKAVAEARVLYHSDLKGHKAHFSIIVWEHD